MIGEYGTRNLMCHFVSTRYIEKTRWKKRHQSAIGLGAPVFFLLMTCCLFFPLLIHFKGVQEHSVLLKEAGSESSRPAPQPRRWLQGRILYFGRSELAVEVGRCVAQTRYSHRNLTRRVRTLTLMPATVTDERELCSGANSGVVSEEAEPECLHRGAAAAELNISPERVPASAGPPGPRARARGRIDLSNKNRCLLFAQHLVTLGTRRMCPGSVSRVADARGVAAGTPALHAGRTHSGGVMCPRPGGWGRGRRGSGGPGWLSEDPQCHLPLGTRVSS